MKTYDYTISVLDGEGILRVGGRLGRANLPTGDKTPVLVPGKHHIAKLLVVYHQGQHLTERSIRRACYWITGGKRLISSILHSCVQCRKLQGRAE